MSRTTLLLILLQATLTFITVSSRIREMYPRGNSENKMELLKWHQLQKRLLTRLERLRSRRDVSTHNMDMLIKALHHVENVEKHMASHCNKNQSVTLDVSFDHSRWKQEAAFVLEVANLVTSLWRIKAGDGFSIAENDTFLYTLVRSSVLFSPSVFGSVICFEGYQYRNQERFCPYAYRDKNLNGDLHITDTFSVTHDYLTTNDTIWWRESREKALQMTPDQITVHFTTRFNATASRPLRNATVPVATDMERYGYWTRPYFDCFGGKIWMVTFLAPFFNETDHFLGVVSIDIELSDIDINQCDVDIRTAQKTTGDKAGSTHPVKLLEFLGTHRCKKSTKCVAIPHQGFKRGSYLCECRKGYYFPSTSSFDKNFNGSIIEAEYDKMLKGLPNDYNDNFECLKCSDGCTECTDDRKCVYAVTVASRALLAAIDGLAVLMAFGFGLLVLVNRDVKVFYASSPFLLGVIITGGILMYSAFGIIYPHPPTASLCILFPWLQNIGFALAYCSLALKTWRVSTTFRVRTPRKVEVTDVTMVKHLTLVLLGYVIYLLVWTLTFPPRVETVVNVDKLKYYRCSSNWFDYVTVLCNGLLLSCALWFCYRVRNAPSAYSESRFVSWAIYNAMFVTCFFAILRGLTRKSTNPDVVYAVEFVFVHMMSTVMLLLIFVPKCIIIRKMKLRGVSSSFRSSRKALGPSELSPNGAHLYVTDVGAVERENDDLKTEIKRLSTKVASLQSRLMRERNKHIKTTTNTWKRDRSSTKDDDGEPITDLCKVSPSPISRFLNSQI